MNAFKNLTHAAILGIWALAGAVFTLTTVFGSGSAAMSALVFWLWFAGFAGLTTFAVNQFKGPVAALITHGAALVLLNVVPHVFPLSLLRVGYDLLVNR